MYDLIIIGGGVVGCALARELSFYKAKVLLLEQENDLAEGASIANSGIIHAGHDPHEGSLKARFNREGNEMYEALSQECHFGFQRTGAFVVSKSPSETECLKELQLQAHHRTIEAILLTGDRAREEEPQLARGIEAVLSLPSTGIVDPWDVAIAFGEEAYLNGVEFELNRRVIAIEKHEKGYRVITEQGFFDACGIANAAGVYADEIYRMVEDTPDFSIRARKGNYFVLDRAFSQFMKRPIYPLPSEKGKGMLIVPTLHGNLLLGPDSEFVADKRGIDTETARLRAIREELRSLAENIPWQGVIRTYAGLRASGSTRDFVVREEENHPGFFQAACLESPGLTAAPAIARYLREMIVERFSWQKNENHRTRPEMFSMKGLSLLEKNEIIRHHPAAGRLICYCEEISEAEVMAAIHRPLGAKTVKGVKKRVRPGTGRCQGSFCEPRVVEILARELGISPSEVHYQNSSSWLFYERD